MTSEGKLFNKNILIAVDESENACLNRNKTTSQHLLREKNGSVNINKRSMSC